MQKGDIHIKIILALTCAGFIGFVMLSNPMMLISYDIWEHIGIIDKLIRGLDPEMHRNLWHKSWAIIFKISKIYDIFEIAIIIHRAQFLITGVLIYYSSKLMFESILYQSNSSRTANLNFNNSNHDNIIQSLAISSTLVWFTVIGTVSTFQQAWIMWYSVNYQITLPILMLAISLLLNIFIINHNDGTFYLKFSLSILLLALVYFYHAAELAYLVFYIPIFVVIFVSKEGILKYWKFIVLVFALLFFALQNYTDRKPELIQLLINGDMNSIVDNIRKYGQYNVNGGNRRIANWNEMYILSLLVVIPMMLYANIKKILPQLKASLFVLLSLVFCFIPNFIYTAGIASLVSYAEIVNRYYFASFIHLVVPLFVYVFTFNKFKHAHAFVVFACTFCIIFILYSYSKTSSNKTYFYNILSIKNSIKPLTIGDDMGPDRIKFISSQIELAKIGPAANKIIYCANYRDSYVIKYILRQDNVYFERRRHSTLTDCQNYASNNGYIPFEIH